MYKIKDDKRIEKDGIIFENEEVMKSYEACAEEFARTLYPSIESIKGGGFYNPIYANEIIEDINVTPFMPNLKQLIRMLKNPKTNKDGLLRFSHYLDYNVFQYKRSIQYFAGLLTLNYKMIPTRKPKSKDIKAFKASERIAHEWLRKFKPKIAFEKVLNGVMLEDAKFYYVRESRENIDLQEMPSDYCYITGDSSICYRYAFDMLWFSQYGFTESGFPENHFAPEFKQWYDQFLEIWNNNKRRLSSYKQPMPIEKSVVFKFDDTRATVSPPLSGVFKDALEIQEYKDLLKTQSQLDTWKVIFQEIPLDKNTGKPTIDAKTVGKFVATTQSRMPAYTKTMASPMKPHVINFDSARNKDNIIGDGNSMYWDGVGVAKPLNGGSEINSAGALKLSIISDYSFIKNMLSQFEKFVNYQLSLVTGRYKFEISFMKNDTYYNNAENQANSLKQAQFTGSKLNWLAYQGIEPFQIETENWYEKYLKLDKRIPLTSSHVATSDANNAGRPQKKDTDLEISGENTREYDTNANK